MDKSDNNELRAATAPVSAVPLSDEEYQEILRPVLSRKGMQCYLNADAITLDPSDYRAIIDRARASLPPSAGAPFVHAPYGFEINEFGDSVPAGAPVSAAEPKTVEFDEIAGGQELPALIDAARADFEHWVCSTWPDNGRCLTQPDGRRGESYWDHDVAVAWDAWLPAWNAAMRQPQGDDKSRNWPDYNDDSRIDFTLKKGDIVYSPLWGDGVKPLEIIDTNWALRAVAVRLAKDGAIVVWPVGGLSRVAAKQAGKAPQ